MSLQREPTTTAATTTTISTSTATATEFRTLSLPVSITDSGHTTSMDTSSVVATNMIRQAQSDVPTTTTTTTSTTTTEQDGMQSSDHEFSSYHREDAPYLMHGSMGRTMEQRQALTPPPETRRSTNRIHAYAHTPIQSNVDDTAATTATSIVPPISTTSTTTSTTTAVMMERVLFQLHYRICCMVCNTISPNMRLCLEYLLLVLAILAFSALVLLHKSFVFYDNHGGSHNNIATTCLANNLVMHINAANATTTTTTTSTRNNQQYLSHINAAPHVDLLYISILMEEEQNYINGKNYYNNNKNDSNQKDILDYPTTTLLLQPDHYHQQKHQLHQKQQQQQTKDESFNSKTIPQTCKNIDNDGIEYDDFGDVPETCISPTNIKQQQQQQKLHQQQQQHQQLDLIEKYPYQYAFSKTQAYLLLPPEQASQLNLTTYHIFIAPNDANCFGEPFLQFLLWNCWIDFDILVKNWCLGLMSKQLKRNNSTITTDEFYDDKGNANSNTNYNYNYNNDDYNNHVGYLWTSNQQSHIQELVLPTSSSLSSSAMKKEQRHSTYHSSHRRYNNYNMYSNHNNLQQQQQNNSQYVQFLWLLFFKAGRLVQITCLFFFCTTLVSFTLTETQERMLWFTQELRRRVQSNLPLQQLVTIHVVQTFVFVPIMVGMIFFLMECYQGDKVLAFLQLTIVWCVEVYSVVSLRSYQGMIFFPKIFFLLFCLFHVYHFANPYGFGYTALAVIACFMGHSMYFFWHRYELPALAMGYVTVDRPRRIIAPASDVPDDLTMPDQTLEQLQQQRRRNLELGMHQYHHPPASPIVMSPPLEGLAASRSLFGEQSTFSATATTSLAGGSAATTANNTNEMNTTTINGAPHSPIRGGTLLFGSTSHASFSSSSQRTASGVFRNNQNDGEDDDDSYVYFMEGEVVLRRNSHHRQSRSNFAVGNRTSTSDITATPITSNATTTIGLNVEDEDDEQPQQQQQYHDDLQTPLPPAHPFLTSNVNTFSNVERSAEYHRHRQQQQQQQNQEEGSLTTAPTVTTNTPYSEESGGLQAILEVRLTPRHSNATATSTATDVDPTHHHLQQPAPTASTMEPRRSPPPIFPLLPS